MITLDTGDLIRGYATTTAEVNYMISGAEDTTIKVLGSGQLANAEATLYTAGSNEVQVSSLMFHNTGAGVNIVYLYIKPGGTALLLLKVSLAAGYHLYTDGVRVVVTSASGEVVQTFLVATSAEVNTGTDNSKAVTPDALAGSIFGEKMMYVKVLAYDTALTTGDSKTIVTIPDSFNGMNLVDADIAVYTTSSSGNPTVQLHNLDYGGGASDMLSTRMTIDAGGTELSSYTAATPPVIDAAKDDVATGDRIRIDVDVAGTGTTGLDVILTFQLP